MLRYIKNQSYQTIFETESLLYSDFENCVFNRCDFTACDFTGVAFIDCIFNDCNFASAKINYVGFRGAHFHRCDFPEVNFAMVDPLLFDISFTDCNLDYTKFYTLKLQRTVFTNCSIVASDFMASDLTEAIFDACDLHKTTFVDTVCLKTDFFSSYNYTIDPERNKLKKAIFSKDGLVGLLGKYGITVK
ncbi:pentapeptide repeat-containing protein [Flavobacterium sp.]|uniref:pentapeptide repeat-containing protein n=1 Tax=Flavobacterium sp. TaxID=239 RepID=UPI0012146439|nr:pentapeptide repeat-containing protein [Flavobacterium sp.]RZJ71107.1 MAG: pentapeptide repeat-containing protein [Flavobacterium sp.]